MEKELKKKDGVIETLRKDTNIKRKAQSNIKDEIEFLLTEKLTEMENKTRNIIKEEIKRTTEMMKEHSKKSYAEIAKIHQNEIKQANDQIIMANKEKKDIVSRKCNIIIHRLKEDKKDNEERTQQRDKTDIIDILNDIGIYKIPTLTHYRIGKNSEKDRPIKVIFQNEFDKNEVMKNLDKLESSQQISITEDFTIKERQMIKELHEEAKNRNDNNENFIWRVRGSPRTSLRLKKILKKV